MRKTRKLWILALAAVGTMWFHSCNKQEIPGEDLDAKTTVQDYVNMMNSFSLSTVEEITSGNEDGSLKSAEIVPCVSVTVHPNDNGEFWPRSWTLDFGTENCECFLGITRKGKIHVSLSDWWRNENSLRKMTFEDFYYNDNKLEGSKTYLNTGVNESGNLTFTINESDASLTYTDGTSMSWNSEKFSELVEGTETFRFADDVYSVTGGGTGINVDNKNFTFSISSALIYKNGCFYPVSGTIEITTDGQDTTVIDYGSGECDNKATVTTGGVTEEIEL